MKKAQTTIAVVLLAVVAIIAVIGFVLMMAKPVGTGLGIGDIYGPAGKRGIAQTYPMFPSVPGRAIEHPSYPADTKTVGPRTPVMIFFKGEYGALQEASKCWGDLSPLIPNPEEKFSCYVVPTTGVAYEVVGGFPSGSSAKPRMPAGTGGKLGGDIYCYERTPYKRGALLDRISTIVMKKGWKWDIVNGQQVLVCSKGKYFVFPQ